MTSLKDPAVNPIQQVFEALVAELGADRVSNDDSTRDTHAGDWSEAPKHRPTLVVLPRSTDEVARTLRVLTRFGQRAALQGGLTGLAGGATPQGEEVAISLSRMNAIEAFDHIGGTVTVQAGVALETLQREAEAQGWFFPLDFGARGSCQVGGNAATNAGGNRVVRYGTMRNLVLGLEVVLPDGTVMPMMNRVIKNTTGLDLKHLFIGSEGTLGVITRLVLRLEPKPQTSNTALCAISSFENAAKLLKMLRLRLANLSSFELMWDDFLGAAAKVMKLKAPFDTPYPLYVLVETLGFSSEEDQARLEAVLGDAIEQEVIDDVIVAQSLDHSRSLWAYRDSIGELAPSIAPYAAFDIGIPLDSMNAFVDEVRVLMAKHYPNQQHLFFGHLGDGNLHVLSGPYPDTADLLRVEAIVYECVAAKGGAISAEHGIGVVKQPFLSHSRSAREQEIMRAIKAILDPDGILNRGRVYDVAGKSDSSAH